jgi:hypothetical protein
VKATPSPLTTEELRLRHTITVAEYAQIFSVSADLVYEGCASGQIPHLRRGKRIVFAVAPILAALGYDS